MTRCKVKNKLLIKDPQKGLWFPDLSKTYFKNNALLVITTYMHCICCMHALNIN